MVIFVDFHNNVFITCNHSIPQNKNREGVGNFDTLHLIVHLFLHPKYSQLASCQDADASWKSMPIARATVIAMFSQFAYNLTISCVV